MTIYAADGTGNRYTIESNSGEFYTISFAGSPNEYVDTWSCDCPAGRHGKDCKHVQAFIVWHGEYCQGCREWRGETICRCSSETVAATM